MDESGLFRPCYAFCIAIQNAWKLHRDGPCDEESDEFDDVILILDDPTFQTKRETVEKAITTYGKRFANTLDAEQVAWIIDSKVDGLIYETVFGFISGADLDDQGVRRQAQVLVNVITSIFESASETQWVACYPLERCFQLFPEATDFGNFWILNPAANADGNIVTAFEELKKLLSKNCGVAFAPNIEMDSPLSLKRELIANETSAFIPLRPLLVFEYGIGQSEFNEQFLRLKLLQILPRIRLTQLALELEHSKFWGESVRFGLPPENAKFLPNKSQAPGDRFELPNSCLVLNKNGGGTLVDPLEKPRKDVALVFPGDEELGGNEDLIIARAQSDITAFARMCPCIESVHVPDHAPDHFVKLWRELAEPIITLDPNLPKKVRDVVDTQLRLLHIVIAIPRKTSCLSASQLRKRS